MFKLAALIWIILGTVFAGAGIAVIVAVPDLADQAAKLIPIVCTTGALVAIYPSILISKRIQAASRPVGR